MKTISPTDQEPPGIPKPLIGIVGPCGAGKSTLAAGLQQKGYRARAIVQEHSFVKDMWQRLTRPDVLIFLQASCSVGGKRRQMKWTESEWEEQQRRLVHAREHADFHLATDSLGIEEVLDLVLGFLQDRGLLFGGEVTDGDNVP
jgi:cytidylate kinase